MSVIKIGTTFGSLALFSSYGISQPIASPVVDHSSREMMASGKVVSRGHAVSQLRWPGQLTTIERRALRVLIPGESANIYVQIPDEFYMNTIYTCTAVWPNLNADNSRAAGFSLQLINLLVATS